MSNTEQDAPIGTDLAPLSDNAVGLIDRLGIHFVDPDVVAIRVAERLADAQTLDDLLDPDGPRGLREHLGEPFYVVSVDWMRGQYEEGLGFYALINAANENGERVVYTSGSTSVMIQLAKGLQMNWWKGVLVLARRSDTPTARGFHPYKLVKA